MVIQQDSSQSVPKITYFDARGRAEVIRLLLEENNVSYTERRISVDDWPDMKANFTFGQLPVYEDGDFILNQSNAIYRHLGRKFDLYGDTVFEKARCDIIQETFVDAQDQLGGFFWLPDFEKLREGFEKNELPDLLQKLQDLFCTNHNDSGYWVGTRLSYVDFIAWHFLDYVRAFSQKTLNEFHKLNEFKQRMESRSNIAAYLTSGRRPQTMTVPMAPFGGTPETS